MGMKNRERVDTQTTEPERRMPPIRQAPKPEPHSNPENWSTDQWRAFTCRNATDRTFAKKVETTRIKRLQWVEDRLREQIKGRNISAGLRRELWVDVTNDSFNHHPRPDPFTGGWRMPKNPADVLSQIAAGMEL